jgi:GTPase
MSIKLEPESYYGNVEYKRNIITMCKERIYQLTTQLLFRLNEGDGVCYYYLGVDDDGTIYNISEDELNKSIDNLKMMVKSINCEIESIINDNNYVKIKIVKLESNLNFKEIRVLLVGDTYTGKTTFLAFLIKNLLCKNANLFLLNHKHEIESGKSSSIAVHYYYYNYNNNNYRFVFFDTPGDKKYNKTKRKLMDKINFDLKLDFNKIKVIIKNDIFEKIIINNNFFSNNIIEKNKIFDYFLKHYNSHKFIYPYFEENCNCDCVKFIIIKKFYNQDTGTILFGFLERGTIFKNQKLLYQHNNYNENKIITILSIYVDNKEYDFVENKCCFTIRINSIIKSTNSILINLT